MTIDTTVPGLPVGGRRTPAPAVKGTLRMTDFVAATAVAHSPVCDWTTSVDFGLYQNDVFGVCGPTSVANHRRLFTKWLTGVEQRPTQDDVFDLYRRSGNPQFDPATGADDNGVDMRVMLDQLIKVGIGGMKAVAYATIDPHDVDQIQAAVEIFHGALHGVTLTDAQKAQTKAGRWEYVPGSPVWGGHAILGAGFRPGEDDVITWMLRVAVSREFLVHQNDETFIVVWPEHLHDPRVDVARLAAAFKALTGRDLPVPAPAPVPPAPVPLPVPAPVPVPGDADAVLARAFREWLTHPRQYRQLVKAAQAWLAAKAL